MNWENHPSAKLARLYLQRKEVIRKIIQVEDRVPLARGDIDSSVGNSKSIFLKTVTV